ncbi:MAG: hypothetical protein Q9182_003076 [Xanthomendoza sp. 2 TL-2023]
MGALHKYDLTSDVTHLIVGDTDTPKYKFVAKERPDVKCLLPTWIEALRESWMEGGEPHVQALEIQHTLPALYNLRVCVTGFEDLAYRKRLEDLVSDHGGEYRANLTKDVTHLIARETTGAKYKYAMEWNIKIVAAEWLDQSLERGMILDEKLYALSTPPAERGRNAWSRPKTSTASPGKRAFDGDLLPNGPRKLRRVASTKLSSQNVGLWTDIVSHDIKVGESRHDQWSQQLVPHGSSLQEGLSTAVKSEPTGTAITKADSKFSPTTVMNPVPPLAPPMADPLQRMGIFAGKKLCLHGFNEKKTTILHKHLLSHDAAILLDVTSFTPSAMIRPDNEFLLVPHDMPKDEIPLVPKHRHRPIVVTDLWIERNLHRQRYVSPSDNVTNTPFQTFPIPGFEHLTICSTGFEGVDLLHMSRAAKLMGATYDEEFTSKASVLVCQAVPNHEKLRHAQHWNVPAVTADWLWDCIKSGRLKSFQSYLTQPYQARPVPEDLTQALDQVETDREKGLDGIGSNGLAYDALASGEVKLGKTNVDACSRIEETTSHDSLAAVKTNTSKSPPAADHSSPSLPRPVHKSPSPLHEIAPNETPPKSSTSPSKPIELSKPLPSESTLSSAINSLLAHQQNVRSSATSLSNPNSIQPPVRSNVRRKRQLLGRAPSNASNLSRASSVDTVNTDGVGTPVDPTHPLSNNLKPAFARSSNPISNADDPVLNHLFHYDHEPQAEREPLGTDEQEMQMTQLGYQDPDALAWREKVERKMGGAGNGEDAAARERVQEIGVVKDVVGKGAGAVGKRTRQALGR